MYRFLYKNVYKNFWENLELFTLVLCMGVNVTCVSKRGPLIEKGSQMSKQNFWKFFGKIGYLLLNEIIMGQRIKITEEQREHLLGMYNLNEQPSTSLEKDIDKGEKIGFLSDGEFKDLIEKLSKCVDEDGLNKMKRLRPEQKKEFVERMEMALGIHIDRPDRSKG